MEPWPCSIFLVACAHLPVVVNCRLALRDVFPRFQRSTPVPKVDLWIFPTQLSWFCLCWMSSFASCNSRQSYVLKIVLTPALPSVFHAHYSGKLAFVPFPLPSSYSGDYMGWTWIEGGREGVVKSAKLSGVAELVMTRYDSCLSWFILLKRLVVVHTVWRSL